MNKKLNVKMAATSRGFSRGEFKDLYGIECSIQKSSLASEDAIWLGVNKANPQIMASDAARHGVVTTETTGFVPYPVPSCVSFDTRMHLNQKQAAALITILKRFVDSGEL
jgi:hypothetical protein